MRMGKPKPVWLDTVARLYPPISFAMPDYIRKTKPGKRPRPPRITLPEDTFRRQFFKEHPLEAMRPTSIDERTSLADNAAHPDS